MRIRIALLALVAVGVASAAQQHIDFGSPADNDGDNAPTAFHKIEDNFTDNYGAINVLTTDLASLTSLVATKQDLSTDLSTIAGLTPSNDDILQRKAGGWTNRTLTQLKADLSLSAADFGLGNVENTALSTWAGSTNLATLGTIGTGVWNGTPVALTFGGTGASTASGARTNLGLAIGTDVQAFDANLSTWAGKTAPTGTVVGTSDSQTLTNKSIAGSQITSTVATATALAANGTNCSAGAAAQGVDASGNAEGCFTPTAGASSTSTYLLQTADGSLPNAQAMGALGTGLVKNTTTTGVQSIAAQGTDYYAPGGTDVAVVDGGTGSSTASGARTNLGLAIGTDVQAFNSNLTTWAGKTAPAGTVVGTTDSQTLTNKTLTSPALTSPTGIVKGDVGLGNVDNTSDATKNAAVATLTNKSISGGQITSAVATATALAANGTNCSAGNAALGVDASGNAEGCFVPATGAPTTSTYLLQTADGSLPNAQAMGALGTGLVKNTTTTGVQSIAAQGTDYYAPGGTDVAVVDGGTGSSTAAGARTNLGLAIGTDVQAFNSNLTTWAGKTAPTGTVVGTSDSQTLTNKSIAGSQITSAVATATALAANGANCTTGQYAQGVDASGAAEGCAVPAGASIETLLGTTVISQTDTTTQNDLATTGFATARVVNSTGAASVGVTGFTAPANDGRQFIFRNATTDYLRWIPNESTASTAANRVKTPKGLPIFLMPGDAVAFTYDSSVSRWRVTDWATQGQAMGLTQFDDFITTPGSFTTNQTGTGAATGGTANGVDSTFRYVGALAMSMGTTTTGRSSIGTIVSAAIVPTLGPALSVIRAKIPTAVDGTDTYACQYGFVDTVTPNDGVFWEYRWNGSAPEWSQSRLAAGVATRSVVNSPTTGTGAQWLVVFMNANWSRADFIDSSDGIAFTVADSPTTGIPAAANFTGFGADCIKSAGTNARQSDMDFMGYRVDQTR